MKELYGVNEGIANLGFDVYEAIMESIEDSVDANASNININIFEEEFSFEISGKSISSNRISYLIKDDGLGIDRLKEVFDIGKNNEERFKNLEELKCKNGIYHYGIFSHINVGVTIEIFSKLKNKHWKSIEVKYNKKNGAAFISEEKVLDEKDIERLKAICRGSFPSDGGTIIYVKGVTKNNIDLEDHSEEQDIEKKENIKKLISKLILKIGIKYKVLLESNKCKIFVNDDLVKKIDIFLESDDLPENLRTNSYFSKYNIYLREILEALDDEIEKEFLLDKFGGLFDNKEDILDESISVKLYALSKGFKNLGAEYRRKGYLIPSPYYSEFFVRRNNIYIGEPTKIFNHPDFNTFRCELEFSPIFDKYFEVQVNKNKFRISAIVESLIKSKIKNDNKLVGSTVRSKITNALAGKFNNTDEDDEKLTNKTKEEINKLTKILKEQKKVLTCSLINTDNSNFIKEDINKLNKNNFEDDESARNIIKEVKGNSNKYKNICKAFETDFKKDFDALTRRVEKNKNVKKMKFFGNFDGKYNFVEEIIEPSNEAEMYAILVLIKNINPDILPFELLDYDYKDSVDNLIKLKTDIYNELKIPERITGEVEDIEFMKGILSDDIKSSYSDIINGNYCFMEMKMKLPEEMNHSMRFVSHIVCWDKNDNEIMKTDNITYDIDENSLLFNECKRVEIIYLKDELGKIGYKYFDN